MVNRFSCLALWLLLAAPVWAGGVLDRLDELSSGERTATREFLPGDEAFVFSHELRGETLALKWQIAPGYYLYRDRFKVEPAPGVKAELPTLPPSENKDDAEFGRVQIFRGNFGFDVPVTLANAANPSIRITYQGCAEDGICYPPIKKVLALATQASSSAMPLAPPVAAATPVGMSLSDRLAADLGRKSLVGVVGWFLLAGLALALTPCVFPMLPILSGIIVGQRQPITAARSFSLALIYVLAMATTYAAVGVAAGLAGRNLQALFQHPFVLVGFSLLFVALALSMFGFFHLQVPAFLQARVDAHSRKQGSGSLFGVAAMGALSAVIVGPCVAPPLAAALLYLSHEGSPLTGGVALFALGLGMGLPLLVLGASAGRLLPRAGAWMETVKYVFGVVFLGLAIWFLERLIPPAATLALWAVLLIGTAIYLGALEPLRDAASGWQRFWKGIGLALLCYGVVLIVGAAAGAEDPLKPLAPLAGSKQAYAATQHPSFQSVKGPAQVELALAAAQAQGSPVLLDFYADWCIECKRLERNTFTDPGIQQVLRDFVLLRADLTASDADDNALLQQFGLVGPPAVLFFNPEGEELRSHRLIGYLGPQDFGALLAAAYSP